MNPVTEPSLFFFQLTRDGTPAGAFLAAGLEGAFFTLAGAILALGLGASLPPTPNNDIVLRAAGAGLGAGAGAAILPPPPPTPPKRLIVAPGGAFST
eukprot:CAMPEP_0178673982 /NCGR_PEP_ID=MMETSP0698-20121128/34608_1 /TAXON_ID=265572 /ORGANISM="Extubocellulus spinifer, Strain CCMP396" /LENGTH=96 /DNA_ID=CAMNT_0020318061 /DNA_START=188 /DNA_END=474 /DNA_ORIENTATION=+